MFTTTIRTGSGSGTAPGTTLADLSLEIVDRILFALDPLDIASVSQTSRFFHEIIYGALDRQFWRGLYLAQALDDPRRTLDHLGRRRRDNGADRADDGRDADDGAATRSERKNANGNRYIDWKGELQRIVRARTALAHPSPSLSCAPEQRTALLRTCIHLITHIPPVASPPGSGGHTPQPSSSSSSSSISYNIRWVQRLVGDGTFFVHAASSWSDMSAEDQQLLARLHALYGLTRRDFDPERRRASQAFVYSLRNHTPERKYGPFLPDASMRVDWTFVWRLVHDLGVLLSDADGVGGGSGEGGDNDEDEEEDEDEDESRYFSPLSVRYSQSVIPRGMDLDKEEDWAWVEGLWSVRYGFMDHREFILYNDPSVLANEPQDTTIFDGTEESLASLDIYFRVSGVEPDPRHPTRPKINIVGEVDGKFNIVGFIKLTDDDQVWWHYRAGNDNQMVWSCDAIGLGGVRSQYGFIGVWSTVFHDVDDPIGPFWLQRELFFEEDD